MASPVDMSLALSPCESQDVTNQIITDIVTMNKDQTGDTAARLKLLEKARSLVTALETPRETMVRHLYAEPTCQAALAIAVDTGLFSEMVTQGDGPCKAADLATKLGVTPSILARVMRHIAAMGYLVEVGADEYCLNNFSKSLSIPIMGDGYPGLCAGNLISLMRFPQYLQKINYAEPGPGEPFKYAQNTDLPIFLWFAENPVPAKQFGHHMAAVVQGQPTWTDIYPAEAGLIDGFQPGPDATLLVDIGGSHGHILQAFHEKLPTAPGRLIVQDLPDVISAIEADKLDSKIERVPHDFFTEQPIKGARGYFMRGILHDWNDEDCKKILDRTRQAMKPGYSKLLINETVISPVSADWQSTALDLVMMGVLGSKERTVSQWEALLESVGFKICKIWRSPVTGLSLIEAELA